MSFVKIYPSSSAFMLGPVVKSSKHTSCVRFLQAQTFSGLSKEELRTEIAPEYAALGALDEFLYAEKLRRLSAPFEREKPFKIDFRGIQISGRMDFVLEDGTIVEKKSTTSANVYKRVFEQGEPEPAHVAQLVSYLSFLNAEKGKLVVTYYELSENLDGYQAVAEREFSVQCLDKNVISLDGKVYPHTVKDLARWYALAEASLSGNLTTTPLGQKPYQPDNKFASACAYCPLREVCDKTADGTPLATFVEAAKPALLDKQPPRSFTIAHNTKRRQINRDKKKESGQAVTE